MVKIKNKDWKDSIENRFKEAEVQNREESLESGDLVQYQNQVTKSKNKSFEEHENKGAKKWRMLEESEKWPTGKEEEGRNLIIEINLKIKQINMRQIRSVRRVTLRSGNDDLQKDHIAAMITHDVMEIANHEEDSNLLIKRL